MATKHRMKSSMGKWRPFLAGGGEAALLQELRGFQGDLPALGRLLRHHIPDVCDVRDSKAIPKGANLIPQRNPLEVDYVNMRWEVIQKFDETILHYLKHVVSRLKIDRHDVVMPKDVERLYRSDCNFLDRFLERFVGQELSHGLHRMFSYREVPVSHPMFYVNEADHYEFRSPVKWLMWGVSDELCLMPLVAMKPVICSTTLYMQRPPYAAAGEMMIGTFMCNGVEMTPAEGWTFQYDRLQDLMGPYKDRWCVSFLDLRRDLLELISVQPDMESNLHGALLEYLHTL